MNADVFVDTNIFLYSIDDSPAAANKRDVARRILQTESWGWSVQVAAEFFVNATSPKRAFQLPVPLAASLVETWLSFPTADITPEVVRDAISRTSDIKPATGTPQSSRRPVASVVERSTART